MDLYGFRKELTKLINRYSREKFSNTPDYILAEYLVDCLLSFDAATRKREAWYSRAPIATQSPTTPRENGASSCDNNVAIQGKK